MADTVKCIYCFKEFDPYTNVHFRALGPITNVSKKEIKLSKTSTEEKENFLSKKIDKKLLNYYIDLGYSQENAEANAKAYKAFTPEEYLNIDSIEVRKKKINDQTYFEKLVFNRENFKTDFYETDVRLCPHCHNILPDRFGIRKSLSISMVGYTNAGKTVFLTALIHTLMHNKNVRATLIPVGQENDYASTIDRYINEIFSKRTLPDATHSKQPPLVYVYTYKYKIKNSKNEIEEVQNSINLVFYDIEGEACTSVQKLQREGNNIRHSDGIIYLLDPIRLEHIAQDLIFLDQANNLGIFERDENGNIIKPNFSKNKAFEVINALFKYMLNEEGEKKSEIPVAFVLTKTDIFDIECVKQNINLLFKDTENKVLPSSFKEDKHKGYLDALDIKSLNTDVINFLEEFNHGEYKDAADLHFENYSFFAVSALNQIPVTKENEKGEKHTTLEKDVVPYRILEPLLWIMSKNNLFSSWQIFNTTDNEVSKKDNKSIFSKVFKIFKG